jgi:hypothetical protein
MSDGSKGCATITVGSGTEQRGYPIERIVAVRFNLHGLEARPSATGPRPDSSFHVLDRAVHAF